jgi:WD40 repeat protein
MSEVQQLQLQQKHGRGQDNIDEEYENLFVTFLNIAFIGETLVTSGDNGYLYLWSNERLEHRTYAHEGSIYALHVNNDQQLLVSGGLEGCVTIWRMNIDPKKNTKSLQRIKVYNLRSKTVDPQTAVMNPETNV